MNSAWITARKRASGTFQTPRSLVKITRRCISTRELDENKGDRERVVILGSGWAGFGLATQLDKRKFQTVIVSPRSYFVFTPLLASTAVGTLEFRTTLEPVRSRRSEIEYYQGWADGIEFTKKIVKVEEASIHQPTGSTSGTSGEARGSISPSVSSPDTLKVQRGEIFDLKYDKLVIAVGCYSQTFGTKGVKENAYFLKDVGDARKIRKRILECFETAALPTTPLELQKKLLNFAIIGGGPTGVEFSAELFDLCHEDLKRLYPDLIEHVKITIYDVAPKILPMFDANLADYAMKLFARDGISIKTEHHIQELRPGLPEQKPGEKDGGCFTLRTKEDGDIGVGMCVWSTGLMMNPFIANGLNVPHKYPSNSAFINSSSNSPISPSIQEWSLKRHPKTGGLMVDDHFRIKLTSSPDSSSTGSNKSSSGQVEATMKDVFALGDVAVMEKSQLPATAQVANQEAKWIGKRLNAGDVDKESFTYKNLGVMTYLGNMKAIMQTEGNTEIKGWRNKLLIPMYWAINWIFGRDISRF
ncbi:hypothetical protein B7463_g11234, partial [Scytalidium lignicola]